MNEKNPSQRKNYKLENKSKKIQGQKIGVREKILIGKWAEEI